MAIESDSCGCGMAQTRTPARFGSRRDDAFHGVPCPFSLFFGKISLFEQRNANDVGVNQTAGMGPCARERGHRQKPNAGNYVTIERRLNGRGTMSAHGLDTEVAVRARQFRSLPPTGSRFLLEV